MRPMNRCLPVVGMMLMCGLALGQNQNQNNSVPSFRGIVLGPAEDHRAFTMVDRDGNTLSIKVGPSTVFDANRSPVNFAAAIVYGMEIRGTYAPDGSAATVSARGQASEIEDEQLQAFMGAADDEWAFLKPKIDRIEQLIRTVEGRGPGGGGRGNAPAARNPIQELQRMLQSGFFNLSMPQAQLRTTLSALRAEQQRARAQLEQARRDLQGFVTTRQEVLLVIMGILE